MTPSSLLQAARPSSALPETANNDKDEGSETADSTRPSSTAPTLNIPPDPVQSPVLRAGSLPNVSDMHINNSIDLGVSHYCFELRVHALRFFSQV